METVTKETALKRISELVDQFDEGYDNFKKTTYDEAKTRGTFIDEFFNALGWDIHNKEGLNESYRDVIPEDKIKVEGRTKAPDYCFTIYGQRKFFVEAKKPSVPIKTDNASVFQLRRYGYHNKLPISIITNFEEFVIYDCTKKPFLTDKTSVGRILHINYKEYVKDFDFLWNTFTKESVLKGRFDKFVKSDTEKRGTSTIDTDFLGSLNEWRMYLAKSIAWNNQRLTQEEVQYAVQQTIDRIIFLIFCEYKKIEPWGNLKSTTRKGNVYKNLFELFNNADAKYNSGLFDLKKDQISEKLTVDNKVIDTIVSDLYPPNSEYDFSIFPVEVLGNAYEQFLGKIIRITPGHIVKIEDKPEVKKAGGVFYTPEYIVDYIVKNTVGKLIHDKTPEQISKIKIVDPACGSGSFLLGAYQFLLNYHTDYYLKKGYREKKIKNNPITPEGRLSTEEKREILLNNIFGVDIDTQAVEVTKLSLLLKAMEGETEASIKRQLQLFQERVLPNIDGNIKCGNSLIGQDFFTGQLELDKEEKEALKKKIKPFDWKSGFPDVFKQGGFDIVIGNPPYFRIEAERPESNYLRTKYTTPEFKLDIYTLFIEKFVKEGFKKFGFIIPNTLLTNLTDKKLRKLILEKSNVVEIVNYRIRVFAEAVVHTMVIILDDNLKVKKIKITEVNPDKTETFEIEKSKLLENDNYSFDIRLFGDNASIFEKLKKKSVVLDDICEVKQAIKTGDDKKYIHDKKLKSNYKPVIGGSEIQRYQLNYGSRYIDYGSHLACPRNPRIFEASEKILIRETGKRISATFDNKKYYILSSLYSVLLKEKQEYNLKYILGVINSILSQLFMKAFCFDNSSGAFIKARIFNYKQLPIKSINFKNQKEKFIHDEIVKQVDNLLQLNKDLRKTKIPSQNEQIKNQISYSENRIDELVFELYGLSKKDIETIKNNLP